MPHTACPLKNTGAVCGGSAGDGVDTEVEAIVGGEHENERGGTFDAKNGKANRLGSISVWGIQTARRHLEEVHWDGWIR
jgi:hypothetical protein